MQLSRNSHDIATEAVPPIPAQPKGMVVAARFSGAGRRPPFAAEVLVKHHWKFLYFSFRDLWARYTRAHDDPDFGKQVLKDALSPNSTEEAIRRKVVPLGKTVDFERDWPRIQQLRSAWEELDQLGDREEPAESVYQTAIQIVKRQLEDREYNWKGEKRWFYRGQRKFEWSVRPSIFRELPSDETAIVELQARIDRARRAVAALRRKGLASTDFECLAIAQHYHDVLSIRTWLLDVTESPWVALFLASYGGITGEVGTIECIERDEWLSFSDHGNNWLGAMRCVSPRGIPRISNQSAFFLEAPHPELYRQLVNRRLCFRQKSGVVFEDQSLQTPVLRARILPDPDPTIARLPADWGSDVAAPLMREPTRASLDSPNADVFFAVVRPWLAQATPAQRDVIRGVCALHAEFTRRRDRLPPPLVTLHHLRRVARYVLSLPELTLEWLLRFKYTGALEQTRPIAPELARSAFLDSVQAGQPQWLSAAKRAIGSSCPR